MKTRIPFLLIFFCFLICIAVADDFLETIPLEGNQCLSSATVLESGDILAAGVDFSANDILLHKISSSGVVLKSQRISGSGADEAQAVLATPDGGAVIIGSTNSFGEGNTDGFLLRLRRSGSIAWKRTFGTSGNEHLVKIVQASDNGFIVLGDADHDPNLNDIVVAKFNSRGHSVWTRVISAADFDHASDLALTSDNGAIVAIGAIFTGGDRSVIVKFAANGAIQWSRIYGSSGNHAAVSIHEDPNGGYYFTEIYVASGSSRSTTLLSKLDSEGIPVWSRIYKATGVNLVASVTLMEEGNQLLLSGATTLLNGNDSRGILIGLRRNGKKLWTKRLKTDSRPLVFGRPIIDSTNGSILLAGCVGTRESNDMDSLILQSNGNGTIDGGCSKLKKFSVSTSRFNLSSQEFVVDDIPVPFSNARAGFSQASFSANQSSVCSGE